MLAIVAVVLRRLRVSAIGRAIIAVRDNEPAAAAFAIGTVRVKLTAFAISGGVAGVGGALFVHLNQSFDLASYDAGESLDVFVASVVGGLGSLAGAVLGALFLWGVRWFVPANEWRFLASASGVLLVLLLLPGGLVGLHRCACATSSSPSVGRSPVSARRAIRPPASGTPAAGCARCAAVSRSIRS